MVNSQVLNDIAVINPDPHFWRGRKVALTGHTGFKGSWLSILLHSLGAKVHAYALAPHTQPNLYDAAHVSELLDSHIGDVRDAHALTHWLQESKAEVVFHLAAQALVRASYDDPVNTFSSNFVGTMNLLEAVRQTPSVKSVVVVTTDKVYRNEENARSYEEGDPLGGHDPYSASKAACEILVASYRSSFLSHIGIATARAGNVIGGGDWSDDRLIPDAIRAWSHQQTLSIRRPDSVRPWQHVLEPLVGYLILAQRLFDDASLGAAYNFGPDVVDAVSVRQVIDEAIIQFKNGQVNYAQDISGPHEASLLHLNNQLAKQTLGVMPRWHLQDAVQKSVAWYIAQMAGEGARDLCLHDIQRFLNHSLSNE